MNLTLTFRRSSLESGKDIPQLTTARRFLTTTLLKGRDRDVWVQQGTLERAWKMFFINFVSRTKRYLVSFTWATKLLCRARTDLLAGMETPSVAMMARSTFWMLWVTMELSRARARPSLKAPLHSILNIDVISSHLYLKLITFNHSHLVFYNNVIRKNVRERVLAIDKRPPNF